MQTLDKIALHNSIGYSFAAPYQGALFARLYQAHALGNVYIVGIALASI